MNEFALDATLASVSHKIGILRVCEVRLLDDTRWPWLMLVPMRPAMVDLHDLTAADLADAMEDVRDCAHCLQVLVSCDKINVGSLGNIVRQLHIHVIARKEDDANWPGPVWGFGKAELYQDDARADFMAKISKELF
jgi:diadenosine tetraphosphate (Ap4A) HIT family hydrolase